jgi:hypothetical protein
MADHSAKKRKQIPMTNHRTVRQFATVMVLALACTMSAYADEPNEDFDSATVLAPGVLSVLDTLTSSGEFNPDTILGNRDQFGDIEFVDDDSSPSGDGLGSALYEVPTNSGSIDFAVSGYDDFDFVGEHFESGNYEVFVDVYDFSEELIDSFSSGTQMLEEGFVDEYSYFDSAWIGGSYDVYINNGLATIADVDFFTFTGLTPGTPFAARTSDPDELEIDTWLGWFNILGELIEVDDDDAGGLLSLIEGIVPENGELTFAVTGFGDDEFIGQHFESGAYGLELELNPGSLIGDYNNNGVVDAADYTVWRDRLGQSVTLANENPAAASPGLVDAEDYAFWKSHFGNVLPNPGAGSGAALPSAALLSPAVPEPGTFALVTAGLFALFSLRSARAEKRTGTFCCEDSAK